MTPKEKAKELCGKFQIYYWHEENGYMPDDIETKEIIEKICDELINNCHVVNIEYWEEVKQEIEKL